jgi:hypothetical protein
LERDSEVLEQSQVTVQYAKAFIDRIIDANDLFMLYDVVRVLDAERDLAEPLHLFMRLWEWTCATGSGVWQYYENLSTSDFDTIATMMDRHQLSEIAVRYRAGMECWKESGYSDDLDAWIENNESMLEETAMRLIKPHREQLYPTTN